MVQAQQPARERTGLSWAQPLRMAAQAYGQLTILPTLDSRKSDKYVIQALTRTGAERPPYGMFPGALGFRPVAVGMIPLSLIRPRAAPNKRATRANSIPRTTVLRISCLLTYRVVGLVHPYAAFLATGFLVPPTGDFYLNAGRVTEFGLISGVSACSSSLR